MTKIPDNVKTLDTGLKPKNLPKPPETLQKSSEACEWWDRYVTEFAIDDVYGLHNLQIGLEAFIRLREAQAELDRDGLVVRDRYDQVRPHPAAGVEKTSREAMMQALKLLNLDIMPLGQAGRPVSKVL